MAVKSFGVWQNVTLPDSADGTDSQPFSVPRGAKVVTIVVPTLVGASSTVKLQVQSPAVSADESASWSDLGVFDLTDGTREALDGIPEELSTTLPVSALGAGVLRFVASAAQTGAADAITIKLIWGFDN